MSAMLLCAEREMYSSIDKYAEAASQASDSTFLASWQIQKNVHSLGMSFYILNVLRSLHMTFISCSSSS